MLKLNDEKTDSVSTSTNFKLERRGHPVEDELCKEKIVFSTVPLDLTNRAKALANKKKVEVNSF